MKKSISLLLAFLMVFCLLPVSAFAEAEGSEIIPEQVQTTESEGHVLNYHGINVDVAAPTKTTALFSASGAALPSSYSSVTSGLITPVKNQGDYGACWAFSASASSEAAYAKKYGVSESLSALQLAYYFYSTKVDPLGYATGDTTKNMTSTVLDQGGNHFYTMFALAGWTNGAPESALPYNSENLAKALNGTIPGAYANDYDIGHLQNVRILPYGTTASELDAIKQAIKDYGTLSVSYYHNSSYYNAENGAYCCNVASENHAVSLVGWNDAYPASNFSSSCRPSKDGAWLVKNSWGTNWGTDGDADPTNSGKEGYFWISYYDTSLQSAGAAFVFDFAPISKYQYNYQYDGTASYETRNCSATDKVAAVYTIKGLSSDEETLKAVGIGLASTNESGTVSIYRNPSSSNPASGTLLTSTSFSTTYEGYYTIELPNAPVLKKGDTFSVVFSFNSAYTLFVDKSLDGSWVKFTANTANDKTYVISSLFFTFVTNLANSKTTARIKAYTSAVNPIPTYSVTYNANGGSGAPSTQTKYEGSPLTLSSTKPTRAGYNFLGWSENDMAATPDYLAGGTYTADKSATLYAVWEKKIAASLTISDSTIELTCGEASKTVTVTPDPADTICSWTVTGLDDSGVSCVPDGNTFTFTANELKTSPVVATITDTASSEFVTCTITVNPAPVKATELVIDNDTLELIDGGSAQTVTITPTPFDADCSWQVETTSKAVQVEAVNGQPGKFSLKAVSYTANPVVVTFTDTYANLSKTCTVTVKKPTATSVSIFPASLEIEQGKSATVTLTPDPMNAGCTWTYSGAEDVVSVSQSGNVFTVKGLKPGNVTLTFKDTVSKIEKTCTVKVNEVKKSVSVDATVTKSTSRYILFFTSTTYTASITASATGTTVKTVQYSTNNGSSWTTGKSFTSSSNITSFQIRVTDEDGDIYDFQYSNGIVTPIKNIVKATSITVSPSAISLVIGEEPKTVSVSASPANAECEWTVSGENGIVSVSSSGTNYTVTAVKAGTATLTFNDTNSGLSKTCKVTVTKPLVKATDLAIAPESLDLTVGKTQTFTVTPTPSDADCVWSVNAPDGVTVTNSGNTFTVKATKAIEAPVTVKVNDTNSSLFVTCSVTATAPQKSMAVTAKVTSSTERYLLFFTRTTYKATITVSATGTNVKTVQYSTNNSSWTTGTSFTSSSNITTFYIRVTDTDGDVYNYTYSNGKVSPTT